MQTLLLTRVWTREVEDEPSDAQKAALLVCKLGYELFEAGMTMISVIFSDHQENSECQTQTSLRTPNPVLPAASK